MQSFVEACDEFPLIEERMGERQNGSSLRETIRSVSAEKQPEDGMEKDKTNGIRGAFLAGGSTQMIEDPVEGILPETAKTR